MSRKPKPKNTLSAGQRAAMFEEEQRRRTSELSSIEADTRESDVTQPEPEQKKPAPAPQKKKEKPQAATVKVDFAVDGGKTNQLPGMCNGPYSQGADISPLYSKLRVPYVRFDRTEGARSGYVLDISKIFPDMSADARDPESYNFRETDKYILAAANVGAKIIYRLGESFDMSTPEHKLKLHENYDKITAICVNIIKHYNDYFAGGFALGIQDFEVLSHTDLPRVREKNTDGEIFELYTRIANGIKLYDPSLRVGGMSFSAPSQLVRDFIKYCKKKNAPIDFLSVSLYASSVEEMGEQIGQYIHILKNSSYADADIIIGEWAYLPMREGKAGAMDIMRSTSLDSAQQRREAFERQRSVFGAAFVAAGLLKMLEYPEIKTACLESGEASSLWCSICDGFGIPQKPYFALEAFSRLRSGERRLFCVSEQYEGFAHTGVYASASCGEDGAYIMLSAFDGCASIDLRLDNIPDNYYTADIYMLDGVKNMELCNSVQLSGMKKRMVLSVSPYSVILIKVY